MSELIQEGKRYCFSYNGEELRIVCTDSPQEHFPVIAESLVDGSMYRFSKYGVNQFGQLFLAGDYPKAWVLAHPQRGWGRIHYNKEQAEDAAYGIKGAAVVELTFCPKTKKATAEVVS